MIDEIADEILNKLDTSSTSLTEAEWEALCRQVAAGAAARANAARERQEGRVIVARVLSNYGPTIT